MSYTVEVTFIKSMFTNLYPQASMLKEMFQLFSGYLYGKILSNIIMNCPSDMFLFMLYSLY